MAVDTPARVVVVGGGPIGIEAALYARFLGYEVTVFDRGEIGENVRRWGDVRMFTPFGMNSTPLGKAALKAQDSAFTLPADEALLTGREYVEQYLGPLSQTDLLVDHLRPGHTVLSISRQAAASDQPDDLADEESELPLVTRAVDSQGAEHRIESEIVLDCSGLYGSAEHLDSDGPPTLRELALQGTIAHGVVDLSANGGYGGRRTLVIGEGYLAAVNLVQLGSLGVQFPQTEVTWITREPLLAGQAGPVPMILEDRLPERQRLAQQANELVAAGGPIVHWPGTALQTIDYDRQADQFRVTLTGEHAGQYSFDRVVASMSYRPDHQIHSGLQVPTCPSTGAPLQLAAQLLACESTDGLDVRCQQPSALVQPEPNFYILGAKSYGRLPSFLLEAGFDQIRQVFSIIGDRENLNLYAQPF